MCVGEHHKSHSYCSSFRCSNCLLFKGRCAPARIGIHLSTPVNRILDQVIPGSLIKLKKKRENSAAASYRGVAVHAAHTVEIDGGLALIGEAVIKAASRTVAPFLVRVVECHLETHIHTNT